MQSLTQYTYVMNAIVIKKSSLERVNSLLYSDPSSVSSISRVEYVSNSAIFYFVSTFELSHASTLLYDAGILHRCCIL